MAPRRGSIARPSMRACRMSLPRRFLHYFIAGLLVAEGSFGKREHRNPGRFTFTNTNSLFIKLVFNFLTKELGIPEETVSIYITYNKRIADIEPQELIEYWSKELNIKPEKIKIYPYTREVKKLRTRAKHGICQIRINDKKARNKIENFINSTLQQIITAAGEGHTESP